MMGEEEDDFFFAVLQLWRSMVWWLLLSVQMNEQADRNFLTRNSKKETMY